MATTGRPDAIGERPGPGRVVDGARRPAAVRSPRRSERRAPQQERIDGQRPGAQQPGRWQEAPADDLEAPVRDGRVVEVAAQQERERLARRAARHRTPRAGRRGRRPSSGARSGSWSGRASSTTRTPGDPAGIGPRSVAWCRRAVWAGERRGPGRGPGCRAGSSRRRRTGVGRGTRSRPGRSRPRSPAQQPVRSSSARSWTTTTSASTTIRRRHLALAHAAIAER